MIFKLEKPKPRNGRFCPALLNVWVIDTELISKQCYPEYAQMKATKLKVVNAIDKLNYNRRQWANPPKTIDVARFRYLALRPKSGSMFSTFISRICLLRWQCLLRNLYRR